MTTESSWKSLYRIILCVRLFNFGIAYGSPVKIFIMTDVIYRLGKNVRYIASTLLGTWLSK